MVGEGMHPCGRKFCGTVNVHVRLAQTPPLVRAVLYHIVEALCDTIAWHLKNLKKDVRPDFKVVQVKEKFAGLRFYVDNADAAIDGMIYMAENWADKSCEVCGNRGTRRNTGWLRVLCDEHAKGTENEDPDCE